MAQKQAAMKKQATKKAVKKYMDMEPYTGKIKGKFMLSLKCMMRNKVVDMFDLGKKQKKIVTCCRRMSRQVEIYKSGVWCVSVPKK